MSQEVTVRSGCVTPAAVVDGQCPLPSASTPTVVAEEDVDLPEAEVLEHDVALRPPLGQGHVLHPSSEAAPSSDPSSKSLEIRCHHHHSSPVALAPCPPRRAVMHPRPTPSAPRRQPGCHWLWPPEHPRHAPPCRPPPPTVAGPCCLVARRSGPWVPAPVWVPIHDVIGESVGTGQAALQ